MKYKTERVFAKDLQVGDLVFNLEAFAFKDNRIWKLHSISPDRYMQYIFEDQGYDPTGFMKYVSLPPTSEVNKLVDETEIQLVSL